MPSDSTRRFSTRVPFYVRSRPGYPSAVLDFIDRFTGDRDTAASRGGSIGAEPAVKRFFGAGGFDVAGFENHQVLTWQGLLDRVYSSSYMPLPDDPKNSEMIAHLRPLFEQFAEEGTIRIDYETRIYFGKL